MKSLADFLKKIFIYIFLLLIFLELIAVTTNFFTMRKTFYDNIQTISSFLSNISVEFKEEIENKIEIIKIFFSDIENMILKNEDKSLNLIQKKLDRKFSELFEISFVDNSGFVVESTNKKELGLNLTAIKIFKDAIMKARKYSKPIVIYPIYDKGDKSYKIFFIKYIKSKKYFLMLGYKINILNFLLMESKKLSKIKNFKYFFHIDYIIKENNNYKFIKNNIQGNLLFEENHDNLLKLIKDNKDKKIIKKFYEIELYSLIRFKNNPNVIIAFHVMLTSSKFKKEIFIFLISNIMVLFFYLIFASYFYNTLQEKIIIPIKKINKKIKKSEPITKDFLNTDILEIKDLKDSYLKHLENIRLRKFIQRILNMYEKEKENLGRNIHDSIIQDLSYILMQLNDKKLSRLLKNKIKELRKIVIDNDFTLLKLSGFNTYLNYLINIYQKRYPNIKFYKKVEKLNISPDVSINLIRIIQEIINNSVKHSNCSKINIEIFLDKENKLNISIGDNGQGFNVEDVEQKLEHFGLFHIKERVYSLNGKLSLNSSSNNGTYYYIVIPII